MTKKTDAERLQVPLEPLPLSEAERRFLANRLYRHHRQLERKRDKLAVDLPTINPALELFSILTTRMERFTYGIAMCQIIAERLGLDLSTHSLDYDADDGYRPD